MQIITLEKEKLKD